MKTSELKDKSVEELVELGKTTKGALFQARLQNFTNQLDNTSSIPKGRRDVARIKTELRRRELEALTAALKSAATATTEGSK
jgi:large subunit ribosomal protein L29